MERGNPSSNVWNPPPYFVLKIGGGRMSRGTNLTNSFLGDSARIEEANLIAADLTGMRIGELLINSLYNSETIINEKERYLMIPGIGYIDIFQDTIFIDAGENLSYKNFENADLSDLDLSEADLSFSNLKGVNLSNTSLFQANLEGTNLEGADLTDADLEGANLKDNNLDNATFHNTIMPDRSIRGCFKSRSRLKIMRVVES